MFVPGGGDADARLHPSQKVLHAAAAVCRAAPAFVAPEDNYRWQADEWSGGDMGRFSGLVGRAVLVAHTLYLRCGICTLLTLSGMNILKGSPAVNRAGCSRAAARRT
jgi:hypothetical protein